MTLASAEQASRASVAHMRGDFNFATLSLSPSVYLYPRASAARHPKNRRASGGPFSAASYRTDFYVVTRYIAAAADDSRNSPRQGGSTDTDGYPAQGDFLCRPEILIDLSLSRPVSNFLNVRERKGRKHSARS